MSVDAAKRLEAAGQAHLVAHSDTLPEDRREPFLQAASEHPWDALAQALAVPEKGGAQALRPPQALTWTRQERQPALRARLLKLGGGLLAGGRVAAFLLAGGQGTRLGLDGPKGNVEFGPDAGRTLFRIHAERVAAVSERVGRAVPLFVLASPETETATREAFEAARDWGLQDGQCRILVQGMLPALDEEGRALLRAPGELALAPDGHGGAFEALVQEGVIGELDSQGIDVLSTYQVDNPLARPLDPLMLGWMVERRLEAVGKAVRKATPDEKVGVFARTVQGRMRVVEYTELEASAVDSADEAVEAPLLLGSIAVHGFAVSFLRRLAEAGHDLPLHRARKKVPHLAADGSMVEPAETNAWKLERFLFDLFPQATRAEVHEVRREWEFAPVKNAEGVDSLVSARVMVEAEVRRWHRERGLEDPVHARLKPRVIDGGIERA